MRDLSIRAPLYALAAVVAIPIAILLYSSGPAGIASSMEDPQFLSSLGVTVLGASIATALNALLGTPAAYALARRMVRWHGALYDLLLSPVSIPHTVVGIMLLLVFSPASPLYGALGALNPLDTLWGMSLAMFYVSAPIYVMAMREHFERSDPELEHFMGSLGLSPSAVFYSILVRGSIGSIARISLLSMGRAISEFGSLVILAYSVSLAPLFYYVKPATVLIWYKYDVYGLSSAVGYASALLLVTLALSMLAYLASGDRGEGEGALTRGIQRAPRGLRGGPPGPRGGPRGEGAAVRPQRFGQDDAHAGRDRRDRIEGRRRGDGEGRVEAPDS
ncbi:MAG: ABC transporter permease [Nitrososphaeria archaeon]